ncbi:MAG: type II secretion system F family protein [Kiritimatiellae bacterium]|nr:type II secretion system F family protein [Kiritimatiellia bacterium]MDD5520403.1 type II secretion system F family protein [Kiritimatiellia bacterium]
MSSFAVMLIVPFLFAVSLAGLTYVLMRSTFSGAEQYTGSYSEQMARQFEEVFMFVPPQQIARMGWAAAVISFIAIFLLIGGFSSKTGFLAGTLVGLLVAVPALYTPKFLLRFLKNRRLLKFNLQLVDTLVNMSNALKAGFSITQAFESIVKEGEMPIAQEFDMFLQQTRLGVNFSDALTNMEQRVGSDDLSLVVNAIETARKTGGNLTEIFEKIASTIRERMRIETRIQTLTAQGRLQGIIVSLMPVVIGVALSIVDPGLMMPFLHSMSGMLIIVGVVILIVCGGLVIRKIVDIDV